MARSSTSRCRAGSCAAPLRGTAHFYCPSHWRHLLETLDATICQLYREAREIYVGRSNDPERRLLEHLVEYERDHLAVLHWSSDQAEIEKLETELIELTSRYSKQANLEGASRGSWRGQWNCVYVAWCWKNSSRGLPGLRFRKVDGLYHPRLVPDCTRFPKEPDFLRATVSPGQAARILEELQDAREQLWARRQARYS